MKNWGSWFHRRLGWFAGGGFEWVVQGLSP